jgi:hypothetical protein
MFVCMLAPENNSSKYEMLGNSRSVFKSIQWYEIVITKREICNEPSDLIFFSRACIARIVLSEKRVMLTRVSAPKRDQSLSFYSRSSCDLSTTLALHQNSPSLAIAAPNPCVDLL